MSSHFIRSLHGLGKNESGGVAIISAVLMLSLLAAIGGALDFWRANEARASLQTSLDAALLAAAKKSMKDEEVIKLELANFFNANGGWRKDLEGITVEVEILEDRLLAKATGDMPTGLMRLIGRETLDVGVVSEAKRGGGPVEIAMVLDVTGSMKDNMGDLRTAGKDLVNQVFDAAAGDTERVYVSLVPYAGVVNIGNSNRQLAWMDTDAKSRYHAKHWENRIIANEKSGDRKKRREGTCREKPKDPPGNGGGNGNGNGNGNGGNNGGGNNGGGSSNPTPPPPPPPSPPPRPPREGGGDRTDADEFFTWPQELLAGLTGLVTVDGAEAAVRDLTPTVERVTSNISKLNGKDVEDCRYVWYRLRNPKKINLFDVFDAMPNASWGGCVEARREPYDVTDAEPRANNADTLWVPYLWWDHADKPPSGDREGHNSYLYDEPYNGLGSQNFHYKGIHYESAASDTSRMANILKYLENRHVQLTDKWAGDIGPNRACPAPIVPLGNDRDTLLSAIDDLEHMPGGGTNGAVGFAWGWRTLSPSPPFDEGVKYGEKKKIIVMMTDGKNDYQANSAAGLSSDLGAYGFSAERRNGNSSNVSSQDYLWHIDERFEEACKNFKAINKSNVPVEEQDVIVFTITFGVSDKWTRQLYEDCASKKPWNYNVDTADELVEAFRTIGNIIAELHLSK